MDNIIKDYLKKTTDIISKIDHSEIEEVVYELKKIRSNKKQVFIFGNGGSAATAEHMAIDLSFNTGLIGPKLKTICLSSNSSSITATGNDLDFESIFSRQLEILAEKNDTIIMISASGNSKNLIRASEIARKLGLNQIAILGFDGGKLLKLVDKSIHIKTPIGSYGITEDIHLAINHILVECLKSGT